MYFECQVHTLLMSRSVNLPKSFIAINLSEISPQLFGPIRKGSIASMSDDMETPKAEGADSLGAGSLGESQTLDVQDMAGGSMSS